MWALLYGPWFLETPMFQLSLLIMVADTSNGPDNRIGISFGPYGMF